MLYDLPDDESALVAHTRIVSRLVCEFSLGLTIATYPKNYLDHSIEGHTGKENLKSFFCGATTDQELIQPFARDYQRHIFRLICKSSGKSPSVFFQLAAIIAQVPSYELFEKRISVFAYVPQDTSLFFVLRVKGDTSLNRGIFNLMMGGN